MTARMAPRHPFVELLARYGAILRAAWAARRELAGPKRLSDELAFLPAALSLQETPAHPAPRRAAVAICALVVTAIVGAIMFLHQPLFAAWPFAAAAMILGLTAWWLYDDKRAERSLLNGILASLVLSVALYGLVIPYLTPLFPSVGLARVLRNVDCPGPVAASVGFQEPSLVFMAGTQTLLTTASGAADFLAQGKCRFAFIDSRQERAFAQRAEDIGLRYAVTAHVDGYNYSQGRDVSIAVFRADGTP